MAVTTQQPNTPGTGERHALDHAEVWARPHDPRSNTRPPGNGDRDERETTKSEDKLLAVLGN